MKFYSRGFAIETTKSCRVLGIGFPCNFHIAAGLAAYMRTEHERGKKLIKSANIKIE